MLECSKIARYFLTCADEEAGDSISNLKLQKLVYYSQGLHLALHDKPLFPEVIEAWTHGPVVPELYRAYRKYGAGAIPREEIAPADYDESTREVLDEVWTVYGQFSALKLRAMTHEEGPWLQAYQVGTGEISLASLRAFFKTQLVEQ